MFTQNIVAEKSLHNVPWSLFVMLLSIIIQKNKNVKNQKLFPAAFLPTDNLFMFYVFPKRMLCIFNVCYKYDINSLFFLHQVHLLYICIM